MQIRFNASLDNGEAEISKATLRDLAEMDPLLAADILQDVVHDATTAYNAAVERLHASWEAARATKQ